LHCQKNIRDVCKISSPVNEYEFAFATEDGLFFGVLDIKMPQKVITFDFKENKNESYFKG